MSERLNKDIEITDLPAEETLTPEEKERLAGAGRKPYLPQFETLEKREMMDAGLGGGIEAPIQLPGGGDAAGTAHVRNMSSQGATNAGRQINPLFGNDILAQMGDQRAEKQWVETPSNASSSAFQLTGANFKDGERLPNSSDIDVENKVPTLKLENTPTTTKSLALTVVDINAKNSPGGQHTHWVLFNIPAGTREIRGTENGGFAGFDANGKQTFSSSDLGQTRQGADDWQGPNPPKGDTPHKYVFTVYALNTAQLKTATGEPLEAGATKAQVEAAMNPHIVGQTSITGTFSK